MHTRNINARWNADVQSSFFCFVPSYNNTCNVFSALEPDNYISKDRIICKPMKLNGIVVDYAGNKEESKMHYVQITVNPIICLS